MKNKTSLHWLVLTMATQIALTGWTGTPCLASPVPQEDPAPPAIEIQKLTNGVDCDAAPGPAIPVGERVTWTYVLTNVGGETLYNLAVADSSGVEISCPGTETLESGEMMTCGAYTIAQVGPFRSRAVVAAATIDGLVVDDSDPAFHVGVTSKGKAGPAAIAIEKLVGGVDVDSAPGPSFQAGETVTWTYVITNTGGVTLRDVAVTDSQGAEVSCPGTETLEAGESMTCGATAVVAPGPDRSLGLATGVAPDGTLVADRDPSYHVGI